MLRSPHPCPANAPTAPTVTGQPLAKIAAEFGMNAPQLALAWLLHVSPNTLLIPGTTSLAHLEENLRAGDVSLTAQDLEAITRTVDAAGITTWRPGASTQPSHAC
ncbi:aldo/keto reductase [Streptomyces murinus]|uniref:aldo/keto reductase n=1 Tax=Streptomyces murinus TaxID=33900 RepID=UPI00340E8E61